MFLLPPESYLMIVKSVKILDVSVQVSTKEDMIDLQVMAVHKHKKA